ncbi:FAD-linked oxidoreductase apf9 [Colletotrichum orbiculare MAFF 240422]|uniref:FAD-linked oxidoreductase apf9 n=1 Tax=Colletotrichum orbiculare (strain 104-T / ATCC 96160 / CBS 514.97 / LARS 414 / MAFF 240422) TaxID=1213857 RepID=A0A484FR13_COLOR|nr:FAD-linked oxidoreductase apf9 [Colletotrichum orbiculare MAFF 240422]
MLYVAACAAVLLAAFLLKQLVWHPLAAYPGPWLGRCTDLYAAYHAWRGTLHVDMLRCHEKYGPVVRYCPSRLLFNSNSAARDISAHGGNVIKSKAYHALVHSAPNTLTIRNRDDHARRRRILSLAFSDAQLRAYESILLRHIDTFCLNLGENAESQQSGSGGALDMARHCDYFTFDVMSEAIFGMKYHTQREPKYRYVMHALEESNVRISALVQASVLAIGRLDKLLFASSIKARNRFLGFLASLLKNRSKASFSDNGNVFSYLETAKDPNGESTLTKSEIRAESATLVVAGSDTSSTTLAATMFYLSGNEKAYTRLCEQIRSTFKTVDEIRLGPKLSSCSYLRACIDEALRMSPPVGGALWREVRQGGMTIDSVWVPEGIDVGTGIYSLHHHASYFESPYEYRPERWIVGEGGPTQKSVGLARSSFFPFSSGPRSCVGKGFAYHEITLTLARVLFKFDFKRLAEDQMASGGSTGNPDESTGFGSLSIWLQNYRKGFTFYDDFQTVNSCSKSDWQGGALTIAGAYAWSDIYPAAFERNLIIVGGNNRGPSSTGGWVQGGGHSPVTRYHGLGADQVLSARVVLASGEVVTASPCENPDVFYAIRGGGGGTYGVVTQMTVKTYPTTNVNVINVDVGTSSASPNMTSRFLDAMTDIYASYPYLSQAGFGGYGAWVADSPIPIGGNNFTTLFQQSFTTFGKDAADTTRLFQPVADMIARLQDSGFAVVISQKSFVDYGAYYANKSGTDAAVGSASALASRLLGREVLEGNWTRLRAAMETMAGPNGAVFHTIVHHGLETSPETRDNSSAVQPGWYNSVILDIFERPMLDGLSVAANIDLFDDIRQNILPAYRALSPTTGTYMNEADWGEERFAEDFYSTNYKKLLEIKTKYDPLGVFYCPTCVGSDAWSEDAGGALCRR